jgi:hypothetical protein
MQMIVLAYEEADPIAGNSPNRHDYVSYTS